MIIKYKDKRNDTKTDQRKVYQIKSRPHKSPVLVILYLISCIVFILSVVTLLWNYTQLRIDEYELNQLSSLHESEREIIDSFERIISESTAGKRQLMDVETNIIPVQSLFAHKTTQTANQKKTEKVILDKYQELYTENTDMIGWIQIEDTKINYPVMFTKDDFYLNHNFDKKKSITGIPYVDQRFSVDPFYTNTIIHGHNMKDGSMFSSILRYKDIEYYKKHPIIKFNTLYEEKEYEVIAAFPSKIYPKNDQESFKPYQFINAKNKQEFNTYIDNIKKLSVIDVGATAEYGDHLITLMTCAYHTENGRFLVVAREMKQS